MSDLEQYNEDQAAIYQNEQEQFQQEFYDLKNNADSAFNGYPLFLIELSKQLNEQPSRSTAHPFYQVRCKRLYVTEEGYNSDLFVVQDAEGEVWRHGDDESKLAEYLFDNYADWLFDLFGDDSINLTVDYIMNNYDFNCDDLPDDCKKLWMQEIEEVVSTHLTLDGAEQFIKRKQHDYPKIFTYAESAYWSPQLRELQDWIKSLTKGP